MGKSISVVLAGIGGYGRTYLRHLLGPSGGGDFQLVAVADPAPEKSDRYPDVVARRIPIFESIESLLAKTRADLAILSTPVQLHARHVKTCLAAGCHVLCEKPLAASTSDVRELIAARDSAGRFVGVGYQWSFTQPIARLKQDIISGMLGRPVRLSTLALWPRGDQYYSRNRWAGRVRDDSGLPVLDSPINNACAHFVHNAFFVLGDQINSSARPVDVTAELYRANPIENFDTAAVRCNIETSAGRVESLFFMSHAVARLRGPVLHYEFERGTVTYDDHEVNDSSEAAGITARFRDGTVRHYGAMPASDDPTKIWHMLDCVRTGTPPVCGIEAAAAQTAMICAAQESSPVIHQLPESSIAVETRAAGPLRWVRDLELNLTDCFNRYVMPSEAGYSWARAGKTVSVNPI